MSAPKLVTEFYERIWNAGELSAISELLSEAFVFRGSLGNEMRGHKPFEDYVRSVRGSLSNYHCEILDCVSEENRAFAKMRFSGIHIAPFRGFPPSGNLVAWLGAALFRFENERISELWVLGDLAGLDEILRKNQITD